MFMYLADVTIKKYLQEGLIEITPKVSAQDIRPAGVRIHLAPKILVPSPGYADLSGPSELDYKTIVMKKDGFVLEPNGFILASTAEKIKTASNIIAFLDGRSTSARLGLTIHVTAGAIDGNHDDARTITLEVKNLGVHSICLHENDSVGQLMFALLSDNIQQKSQSQYAGQDGVLPPNLAFRPGVDK